MLGQNNPLGVTLSSLLFGFMDALSIRLQGYALPTQFTMVPPYVMTLAAMFFFKDRAYLQQTGRIEGR
jgi:simple sugar transport system permease protein